MKALWITPLALMGCVEVEPAISQFNGSSVSVQSPGLHTQAPSADEAAPAVATCAKAGKKAEFASSRMVGSATVEYLFLCV